MWLGLNTLEVISFTHYKFVIVCQYPGVGRSVMASLGQHAKNKKPKRQTAGEYTLACDR